MVNWKNLILFGGIALGGYLLVKKSQESSGGSGINPIIPKGKEALFDYAVGINDISQLKTVMEETPVGVNPLLFSGEHEVVNVPVGTQIEKYIPTSAYGDSHSAASIQAVKDKAIVIENLGADPKDLLVYDPSGHRIYQNWQ